VHALSVYMAVQGGLRAHYYSSIHMGAGSPHPTVTRIDRSVTGNLIVTNSHLELQTEGFVSDH
jgi:hypothetical protein